MKIGMVSSSALIRVIAEKLKQYHAKNIVLDPVMVATAGSKLISDEAISTLKEMLIPLADVITPNIPEMEVLSGMAIQSAQDMERAAKETGDAYHCAVLCKGGHQLNDANDLLYADGEYLWFYGETDCNCQYPWHRLYAVQRYCFKSGKGAQSCGVGGQGESVFIRRAR